MSMTIQAVATPGDSNETTLAAIWGEEGVGKVFLFEDEVYALPGTSASGGGYITVTRLADGQNADLPSNSAIKVALSANLVAVF